MSDDESVPVDDGYVFGTPDPASVPGPRRREDDLRAFYAHRRKKLFLMGLLIFLVGLAVYLIFFSGEGEDKAFDEKCAGLFGSGNFEKYCTEDTFLKSCKCLPVNCHFGNMSISFAECVQLLNAEGK